MQEVNIETVKNYFLNLQQSICVELEKLDGKARFKQDQWEREEGGGGQSRVLTEGAVFEQAGVNFSHVMGASMPGSATAHRPQLAGRSFEAMGVSLVIHPLNPHVPTTHMNVRFFIASKEGEDPIWWFGGGYDLTPYYGYDEDCIHWHQTAKDACDAISTELYPKYKQWCDDYFYLKHRDETRGIGGVFFDDLNELGFADSFGFTKNIGDSFINAYAPIVEERKYQFFTEPERQFQLYRRGRYVEFNLVYDRGTLFGLQSGGRTESILMSMPPLVRWEYGFTPAEGSAEEKLYKEYLVPREWINIENVEEVVEE